MKTNGNTILITGGSSGIGRGLAEALAKAGNQVIITGRRQAPLDEVVRANPGISALQLDVDSPESIRQFAATVIARFPALNVLVNNAGIMKAEALGQDTDTSVAEAIITTNVLGPVRLTAALMPHLKTQPQATVMNVSSAAAFVPLAFTPTYSATKAFVHSYSLSLRKQLERTNVQVLELVPPYVQTELMGSQQATDPRAMPLSDFISEVMTILANPPVSGEIIVENSKPARFAEQSGIFDQLFEMFSAMAEG
ncbi:MAG: SDR family oxidoreductase [Asticcacaulis sp.]